ncbi:MAG: type I 3-dehydroquinate dehydratase [Ruminococcaceae bacterium]|nr:type I 3-dehydroquinate dehydratase [Oscillospiraceae bacterium]
MKKLSEISAPAIAGVIREKNAAAAIAEIKNCMYDGADMIDLHLSCLEANDVDTLRRIVDSSKLPILALNYNKTVDWNNANLSEEERVESFLRAVEAGAAGVDMQGYTFHAPSKNEFCGEDKYSFTKGNPKEVVTDEVIISKQCEFIETVHSKGAEVLLSCHPGIAMNSTQVVELALFLEKRNPDIIKIVTSATNEDEMLEAIKTMLLLKKEVKTPVSYHANGKFGGLTRILNPALGGQIAFCVDRFSESSTLEQLDLKTTKVVIDNLQKFI